MPGLFLIHSASLPIRDASLASIAAALAAGSVIFSALARLFSTAVTFSASLILSKVCMPFSNAARSATPPLTILFTFFSALAIAEVAGSYLANCVFALP